MELSESALIALCPRQHRRDLNMCRATGCAKREAMKGIVLTEAFKPYTAMHTDPLLDQAIIYLNGQIEKLRSLKGSNPEIAMVIGRAVEVFGDLGVLWLVECNRVLQAVPLDLIFQNRIERVLTQIARIEHGVYA